MLKKAIYAGSFNPWHAGHADILTKILRVFDTAIVAVGINPEKESFAYQDHRFPDFKNYPEITQMSFSGLLVDCIKDYNKEHPEEPITALARGLRSGYDLQYEQNMQYWNEDLGLTVPVVYFISDRSLSHVSSSALRSINKSTGTNRINP